jgi:hypothetical protein
MNPRTPLNRKLVAIKLFHTLVWAFVVACILAIPIAGALRDFLLGAVLSGIVLIECMVLAANKGRCPLTDLASLYTDERADNFDIYLPRWFARYNKLVFGTLFIGGELFVLYLWAIGRK